MKKLCMTLFVVLLFAVGAGAYDEMTRFGRGYVVWESNRQGVWRIYSNTLDGKQGEKQISPKADNKTDHMSAQVSPDGSKVLYMEYPVSSRNWKDKPPIGKMHVIDMKTGRDEVLFDKACDYGGGHSVVFADNDSFIYINGDRKTCLYSFSGKKSRELYDTRGKYHLLFDRTLSYGVCEHPALVFAYDRDKKTVREIAQLRGCMPFHTYDGKWIVWMENAGGPVGAYDPATGVTHHILDNRDKSLPKDRAYVYFPEVSCSMGALAFGASPDQHDHNKSDYDIFVCRIDPKTMTRVGKPVRYSFDGHTDRYPSVYFEEWELGTQSFEGRSEARWTLPGSEKSAVWSFGDGSSEKGGPSARHTYAKPGVYSVEARGSKTYRGTVIVAPPSKPSIARVLPSAGGVSLSLSEPVDIGRMKLGLHSGTAIKSRKLSEDGSRIDIEFESPVEEDLLYVKGIFDLAAEPNRLDITIPINNLQYPVGAPVWYYTPDGETMVYREGVPEPPALKGRAWYAGNHGLCFCGGALDAGVSPGEAIRKSGSFSIVFDACVQRPREYGIIFAAAHRGTTLLSLAAEHDSLVLRMRTFLGVYDSSPVLVLTKAEPGKTVHGAVTYGGDVVNVYLDGRLAASFTDAQGAFDKWDLTGCSAGNMPEGKGDFCGLINAIAVYDRVLSAEEVALDNDRAKRVIKPWAPNGREVRAALTGVSRLPSLEEIAPYKDALINCEFRTREGETLRVLCRGYANGEKVFAYEKGKEYTLLVEPVEDNSQAETIYTADDLEFDAEAPQYFNAGQGFE